MIDFSNVKNIKVDNVVEYRLAQIELGGKIPSLFVVHAGDTSPRYHNAFLKSLKGKTRQFATGNVNAVMLAEMRAADRELYPKYIIKNWKDVIDNVGDQVPFNPENCRQFVEALPDVIFDEIRNFCGQYNNFLTQESLTNEEIENIEKN